jgi:hypothetical protein
LFEDSPGNNDNGKGDSSHGDEVYAASVALLGLAQGDGTKSSRAGSKNSDKNNEMETAVDDTDRVCHRYVFATLYLYPHTLYPWQCRYLTTHNIRSLLQCTTVLLVPVVFNSSYFFKL